MLSYLSAANFMKLRRIFLLPTLLCALSFCALSACKGKGDADDRTANKKGDVVQEDATPPPSKAEARRKKKDPKDEERAKERQEAEKTRQRFLDPELVQSVRAQSGLIQLPPPNVERLLLRADLRDVMLYTGPIHTEPLAGRSPDSLYNAIRFAMGRELGCSVQRWVFPFAHDLVLHYDAYVDTLYEPEEEPRLDAATYFSTVAGVRMVVMRHTASRSMIQLSCTESLLSQRQLRTLSERIISRL